MPSYSWDRRIARAGELAQKNPAVSELLKFYQELARFQKNVYEELSRTSEHNIAVLLPHCSGLLQTAQRAGSPALAEAAQQLETLTPESWIELLLQVWQPLGEAAELPPERAFFARALLQPYAECLAAKANQPPGTAEAVCPFCGSRPQVAVLRPEGEGARRSLMCGLCATEWVYRRVVCPKCGEQEKDKLPVYTAAEFDYVRVDACDNCRTYIKSIDLSKNGHAVPMVDELATVSLNLWAAENDYRKLSPNLFGI